MVLSKVSNAVAGRGYYAREIFIAAANDWRFW